MSEASCRIILIDDLEIDRFIIKRRLGLIGVHCDVIEFGDPADAVTFLAETPALEEPIASLVITDLRMPKVDGYDVIKLIREILHLKTIPLIGITAYQHLYTEQMTILSGADYYFPKPLTKSNFEKIASIINKK